MGIKLEKARHLWREMFWARFAYLAFAALFAPLILSARDAPRRADERILEERAQAQARDIGVRVKAARADAFSRRADLKEVLRKKLVRAPRAPFLRAPGTVQRRALALREGETLWTLLARNHVRPRQIESALRALGKHLDPNLVRAGQKLFMDFAFAPAAEGGVPKRTLLAMRLRPSPDTAIALKRASDRFLHFGEGESASSDAIVSGSRFDRVGFFHIREAGGRAGGMIQKIVRVFSHIVAFQHELRRGDSFDALYALHYDKEGDLIAYGAGGRLLYARLRLRRGAKAHEIWRYPSDGERGAFYDRDGRPVIGLLMKTPLDGARISSHFGMRRHPILGYSRMHRGIDFAAPRGTPVYAAGDGVVEDAGRLGAYGNYIRIRHRGGYQTAYAHLWKFRAGIGKGRFVRQGETIGFVGSTGRSTGAHLHYEILKYSRRRDPLRVALPREVLSDDEMALFRASRREITARFEGLPLSRGAIAARRR